MRGYCPRCKEFRSDTCDDAWLLIWKNGNPICERCESYVDINYQQVKEWVNRKVRENRKEEKEAR